MKSFFNLVLLVSILFGSWACEQEETPAPAKENKLEARAGTDRQVQVGQEVQLDGSASTDGHNETFAFGWSFISKPNNSSAELVEAHTATPSFSPDVVGAYVLELKISNKLGESTDRILITVTEEPHESEEPIAIVLKEPITQDLVLEDIFEDDADADYIVSTDLVVSATLTVMPGVHIKFEQNKSLSIYPQGALIARGNAYQRIYFTGLDNTRGFWKGIAFYSNNPLNELEHVLVSGAGSSNFAEAAGIQAGVLLMGTELSGAALRVSASSFYESAGYGMYVQGMSELNYFHGNYFVNNAGPALYVPARQVHKLDFFTHFTDNNGYNGVETGGKLQEAQEVRWPDFNDGSHYLVSADLSIESGLQLDPGVTLEFTPDVKVQVINGGYLNATGIENNTISFTARIKDHPGYWKGIFFNTKSPLNKLHLAEVAYGGGSAVAPEATAHQANLVIGANGSLSVEGSVIKNSPGWGIVALTAEGATINENIQTLNYFDALAQGQVHVTATEPEEIDLQGEWLDYWSFTNNLRWDAQVYNRATGEWFKGAVTPWTMTPQAGFGLKIDAEGNYIWTIAEHSPGWGCGISFSAEYITGKLSQRPENQLLFEESSWRSRFDNPCDPTQNIDTDVEPGSMVLRYSMEQGYDTLSGQAFWKLTFFNPDGSLFSYYKKRQH